MVETSIDNSPIKRVVLSDASGNPDYNAGSGYSVVKLTADTLVKTGPGVLHTVTFTCNDAAPTAGSVIIFNNTAESGTELLNHTFTTTPFAPCSVLIDGNFTTGLYVGFTTTNDVNVTVSYR